LFSIHCQWDNGDLTCQYTADLQFNVLRKEFECVLIHNDNHLRLSEKEHTKKTLLFQSFFFSNKIYFTGLIYDIEKTTILTL
jgi:hypothetical protein